MADHPVLNFLYASLNWYTCDAAMAEGIDSTTRKRPVSLGSQLQFCIICQNDTQQKLMNVSHDGLQSVDNIRQLRAKIPNANFRDETDRLTEIFQTVVPQTFSWHKDCRSSYMSKLKIERLRKAGLKEMKEPSSSTSMQHAHSQKFSLRSEMPHIDWKKCIFC